MTVLEDTLPSLPDQPAPSPVRIRLGLGLTLLGFFIFVAGAKPEWFGWDRSPVIGFVQITGWLLFVWGGISDW
jgi:hypothetical protein